MMFVYLPHFELARSRNDDAFLFKPGSSVNPCIPNGQIAARVSVAPYYYRNDTLPDNVLTRAHKLNLNDPKIWFLGLPCSSHLRAPSSRSKDRHQVDNDYYAFGSQCTYRSKGHFTPIDSYIYFVRNGYGTDLC